MQSPNRCAVLCWSLQIVVGLALLVGAPDPVSGQDGTDAKLKARYESFSKKFSGAKLKGLFTVDGKPMTDLKDEAYEIVRATKMPQGDKWTLEARIKYGKNDLVVPILLDIKWAGETPVITLDNLTIPGLGTFSSRVVLDGQRYAGTWQHDDVGGHLFGEIILPKAKMESNEKLPKE